MTKAPVAGVYGAAFLMALVLVLVVTGVAWAFGDYQEEAIHYPLGETDLPKEEVELAGHHFPATNIQEPETESAWDVQIYDQRSKRAAKLFSLFTKRARRPDRRSLPSPRKPDISKWGCEVFFIKWFDAKCW